MGPNLMDLTDEELETVWDVLYDRAYYGDDEIVYTKKGDVLRSALAKVEHEAKQVRKLW